MPYTTPLIRQNAILQKLRQKPYSRFEEIQNYAREKLEIQNTIDDKTQTGFSKRTFQRDVLDIGRVYGIYIEYSSAEGGYFIEEDMGSNQALDRMLDSFELLNAFRFTENINPHVQLSNRKPQGTEHLYRLLYAIQQNRWVTLDYQKFWEEEGTSRKLKPYALKEYRDRWYLLAEDQKDGLEKTFGLDRIAELKVSSENFTPSQVDLAEKFRHCFGVIGPLEGDPQKIILSFAPFQGKYIKSLPLHHSQKLLIDNEQEVRIAITVYLTHDLMMELLTFGSQVKVLRPNKLAKRILEEHRKAFEGCAK